MRKGCDYPVETSPASRLTLMKKLTNEKPVILLNLARMKLKIDEEFTLPKSLECKRV